MNKYNEELKIILKNAENEATLLKHPYVGSEHLILSILKSNNKIKEILKYQKITYTKFKNRLIRMMGITNKTIKYFSYTPILKKIINNSYVYNSNSDEISINEIFLSLIDENEGIGIEILNILNCDFETLYTSIIKMQNQSSKSILKEIGLNLCTAKNNSKIIGRNKEIEQIIGILARKNKTNPILIGEAGVGKTAIIESIANMISNKNVPSFLKNKQIISISTSSIISGTKYRGEFEEKLNKIIKEAEENDNIILFIDEIHTLVGAGGAEGAIDASNILKPALARGKIKCIGATTYKEFKKYIENDKAFERRFQKVYIEEPNLEDTIIILNKIKKEYEKFHNVKITKEKIKEIVNLSNLFMPNKKEPDRSIDILDEVCAKTNLFYKKKIVSKKIIKSIIEEKSNSKIYNSFNLKKNMKNYIFGQNTVLEKLDDILNKHNNISPLFIIFEGNEGVGKNFVAESLAKELKRNIIKINMNEYSSETSINRILGSSQGYIGYDDKNTTFEEIKDKPSSIIIIENIEEAHKNVINLLESIYDEGMIKNTRGEKIVFNNCIFIILVNKKESMNIGFNKNIKKKDFQNICMKKIENIIIFHKLTNNIINKIIKKIEIAENFQIDNLYLKKLLSNNKRKYIGIKNIIKDLKKYKVEKIYEK